MKNFCLTTAAAVIITTSLASNLLWVMAFGAAVPDFRGTLRSAVRDLVCGLRDLVDGWVAGRMARSVRQPTLFRLGDDLSHRGLTDIGLQRGQFGPIGPELEGRFRSGEQLLPRCARTAAEARPQ
jgi:hypothetical protein